MRGRVEILKDCLMDSPDRCLYGNTSWEALRAVLAQALQEEEYEGCLGDPALPLVVLTGSVP